MFSYSQDEAAVFVVNLFKYDSKILYVNNQNSQRPLREQPKQPKIKPDNVLDTLLWCTYKTFEAKHDNQEHQLYEEESSSSDNIESDSLPYAKRCTVGYGVDQVTCGSQEVMEKEVRVTNK